MAFCILTYGRSGSTFLVKLLNRHPSISCKGEILHGQKRPVLDAVQKVESLGKGTGVGCKILTNQTRSDGIDIIESNIPKVINIRWNVLQSIVSAYVANKVQNWSNYSTKIKESFTVPYEYIDKVIYRAEKLRDGLISVAKNKDDCVLIQYETLSVKSLNNVAQFLGHSSINSWGLEIRPYRYLAYTYLENRTDLEKKYGYCLPLSSEEEVYKDCLQ
ncbi:MAG: hypothetical protein GF334_12530 [Candidatus Altiarchaeales archaeon]|nr:hypothetical protein [Candidatus Altiarchaeales archaeon]